MKKAIITTLALFALTVSAQTPATPVITWTAPAPIRNPAPLSATQLNATVNAPGNLVYTPPLGTVLAVGNAQTLSVTFTPTDPAAFTAATATVQINVIPTYWPYDPPTTVTVCQMDTSQTPPVPSVDAATELPRCFVVPQAVSQATLQFMLAQTLGLDANGNVVYKYANWWDYIVKFFINDLVNPVLDQFPPPEVAAAKAQAAAAAAAVDAAKAALLQGQQQ